MALRSGTTTMNRVASAIVTRGAFDVGSGKTKLLVADVDIVAGTLVKVRYGIEEDVQFKSDLLASPDEMLSPAIQATGLTTLQALISKAKEHGAEPPYAGIGTDVFRKAKNGMEYLETVRQELQLDLSLATQDEEAVVGLLTAVAMCPSATGPLSSMLSWDSGGGSFQVTNMAEGVPRSFGGQWGSSVAWSALVERVRGEQFEQQSVNPVSPGEARQLQQLILEDLASTPPEPWMRELAAHEDTVLIGIGGETSLFNVLRQVTGKTVQSQSDVTEAIEALLDKNDAQVAELVPKEAWSAVPKLCLMAATFEHLKLPSLHYQSAIGSCAGLLVHDTVMGEQKYWPARTLDAEAEAEKTEP